MRRATMLLAGAGLLAACGEGSGTAPSTTSRQAVPVAKSSTDARRPRLAAVQVTVVDGDTSTRVAGAEVSIGRRFARTDRRGVARVPLVRRAPLVTVVGKRGYSTRAVRLSFRTRPKSTVRVFRRSLQWTTYGAGPARTQTQTALRVRPPFTIVWSRGLDSLLEFPAVVFDGIAYIGNAQGTVWAVDMRDGAVVWRHDTPHGKMASSPAVWGDRLVVHGMDGHVSVLRRSNGRLLWRYETNSPVESSPVVLGGVDVFGSWNGVITALDLRTRRVAWRRYDGCKITSSAAISGGTVYIGDYCGRLLALSARTGAVRFSRQVGGRVYATPAVARGRVFVASSTAGSVTAFTTSGRLLWRRETGSYVYSSPAVWGGRVFFGSYNGRFFCLAAGSGRTLWSVATGGPISGAAVVVAGVAYAGSFAHRIVGVGARSGRVVVDFPHGEYVPVSGSGDRLLLHGYSRLYAVVHR